MKTKKQILCTACEAGHYIEISVRYEAKAADDVEVIIPKVKLLRCEKCGDELIPAETQKEIDRAIAEQTEQLSQRELEQAADTFAIDQTQISEALGLGSKTFHRWLNGTQHPSRSMGYYIRVLVEFPEAFSWLKERTWRRRNRISSKANLNPAVQFPDLAAMTKLSPATCNLDQRLFPVTEGERFNPVTSFTLTKVT